MGFDAAKDPLNLNAREVRVLGCLIEKELSTPDYYPMTLNSLTTACNQKSNRNPVVAYDESDVIEGLDSLQRKRLVGHASSSHTRADKYRHALSEVMNLEEPMLAVLASLMLRGPETLGEVRTRTSRMHSFDSLDEVEDVLQSLADRSPPLVVHLAKRPGQKEARYGHLFAGDPKEDDVQGAGGNVTLEGRVGNVEEKLELLQEQIDELTDAFESFRRQFE